MQNLLFFVPQGELELEVFGDPRFKLLLESVEVFLGASMDVIGGFCQVLIPRIPIVPIASIQFIQIYMS